MAGNERRDQKVSNSKRFFVGLLGWLCLLSAGTGRADVELGGLVLQHDYFLAHYESEFGGQ